MSSDEESVNNDPVVSDIDLVVSDNEILQIGEDQEEQTEEVQREGTLEGEEDGENKDDEKKTVKPKRVIRNPQPKLNEETLKGDRGIAALENYFQRVKFKGKGQEQQDLEVIMKTYEYWCHRLFPKFPFDTCIERLEKLGNKKAVQTHIKRIRFDMLIEDKPILDDSDEEPNVEGFVDIQNDEINQQQNQQFDQLLGSSASAPVRTSVDLTEEQLERIRLNKERAERLRQERLRIIREKAEESLQVSSQLPGTSGVRNEIESKDSMQGDVLSQKDYTLENRKVTNVLDDHTEAIFDHESNIKGKTNAKGVSIKKKPLKRTVLNSNSEKSDNDYSEDEVNHKHALSKKENLNHMESLDNHENSSDSGFAPKKKNKRNTIYDDSEDENSTEKNISTKKLIDSDESDQEMEEAGQSERIINRAEGSREMINDYSNQMDQEIDTYQGPVLEKHSSVLGSSGQPYRPDKSNSAESNTKIDHVAAIELQKLNYDNVKFVNGGLNEYSLGHKSNDLSKITDKKISDSETGNLDTPIKVTQIKKHLINEDQIMEIIEDELEVAILKSTQDVATLKNVENKENSPEDNNL